MLRELNNIEIIKFDENGLVPVVCLDSSLMAEEGLRAYRMQAYANQEAVIRTLEIGKATFWSRSRASIWTKGETSGNELILRGIYTDCDGDSVLYDVIARGPSCHTGAETCFEIPTIGE
ncbi:MAG: hypothetical protein M3P98_04000 [bacterium]|nr:hypothetical protein [bacterium]